MKDTQKKVIKYIEDNKIELKEENEDGDYLFR